MALTVTLLGSTFNTTAGSKTVTATPTLGDMIVVIVTATGVATALGVSETTSPDGHGTYEQITSALKNTSADNMAAFVRSDAVAKSASTVWTTSGDSASTGGGLFVFRIAGATIAGPAFIRQSGAQANGAAAGTPTTALSVGAALTTNALIAVMWNTTNAAPTLTVPTGFAASDYNTNYNTPGTGAQGTHANSGITASTITWGSTSASAFSALAFEMRADQGNLAVTMPPELVAEQGVKRAAFFMQKWQKRRSGLIAPDPGILVPA